MSPTPTRRRGALAAAFALAATLAPALAATPAATAQTWGQCGPLDVAIILDTTGSMGGALSNVQGTISTITNDVVTLSGGNYKLGLLNFKDTITVNVDLAATNKPAVDAAVGPLTATGGANEPEASDEALDTVVNNLTTAGRPQQFGNFSGAWRSNATKYAIMVTDARPGGFDDVHTGADLASVTQVSNDAALNNIKILPIYVPTSATYTPTINSVHSTYASTSGGTTYTSASNGSDVATLVRQAILLNCRPTDVYIRDNTADAGAEPLVGGSAYTSPDIRVCPTTTPCSGVNPTAGQPAYVFVDLRNPGPGGRGTDRGTLRLYYTAQGGGAQWPLHWTQFGMQTGITVPAGVTTVMIPWASVPGPGHFCLLARWESASDPMTFAETTATHQNARNNNNIAWRNIDSVAAVPGTPPIKRPFTLGNPFNDRIATDLVVAGERRFEGKVTIDLGQELTRRWKEAGGRAEGIRQVGETQFDLIDTSRAAFRGLTLNPAERQEIAITFTAGSQAAPGQVLRLYQADQRGEDLGGVEFQITGRQ